MLKGLRETKNRNYTNWISYDLTSEDLILGITFDIFTYSGIAK